MKKPGVKTYPVDKLRTRAAITFIDHICPALFDLEPREKVWRWRNAKVVMSPSSITLLSNQIRRARALGGPETSAKLKQVYEDGPAGLFTAMASASPRPSIYLYPLSDFMDLECRSMLAEKKYSTGLGLLRQNIPYLSPGDHSIILAYLVAEFIACAGICPQLRENLTLLATLAEEVCSSIQQAAPLTRAYGIEPEDLIICLNAQVEVRVPDLQPEGLMLLTTAWNRL